MKKYLKMSLIFAIAASAVAGCKKTSDNNVFSDYDIVDQNANALIKVNYNVAYYNNPFVQIKINGVRVSGTNIRTRYPFPGGGFNTLGGSTGDYLPIKAGSSDILISIPNRGTSTDSIVVFKTNITTTAGQRYSIHVADTLATKSILVQENYTEPDSGKFRMKFVNLIANAPSLDLYNGTSLVATNIPFLGSSSEFTLTSDGTTSTAWTLRVAGSAPNSTAVATYSSASTILQRRVYTAFATGYIGNTDSFRKPYLAFYYVR